MLSFWFHMYEQTFLCVSETGLSHPTDPPFSRSDMKQLQFHCEASCKDRTRAVEDKAEKGLASPTFLSAQYEILNIIKHTTQPNSLLVPCWSKKQNKTKKRLRAEATGGGPKEVDVKKVHCGKQTVGNTWNTICVFFLPAKLRKQQREQIPLQIKLPLLDIYAS